MINYNQLFKKTKELKFFYLLFQLLLHEVGKEINAFVVILIFTAIGPSNDKPQLTKDFVKDIAMTGFSKNISSRGLMNVCKDLIKSGENIKDFILSHSTIWRANKKTILDKAAQHERGYKSC